MLYHRLLRLFFSAAIVALAAAGCGGETVVESGTASSPAATAASGDVESDDEAREDDADDADDTDDATTEPAPAPAATATSVPPTAVPASPGDDEDEDAGDSTGVTSRAGALELLISEGFTAEDAECLVDGAFSVIGTWDFENADTNTAQDDELEQLVDTCVRTVPGPPTGSPPPGTDNELDALWIGCTAGDPDACDDLYFDSPLESDYEAYGFSCGGRAIANCGELLGAGSDSSDGEIPGPAAGSPPPGEDPALDALWVACDGGDADACDDLFWQAPLDSDYEDFGLSCGGRSISGFCADVIGG